jgi:soluble lytic murein transglycosylase-like protein
MKPSGARSKRKLHLIGMACSLACGGAGAQAERSVPYSLVAQVPRVQPTLMVRPAASAPIDLSSRPRAPVFIAAPVPLPTRPLPQSSAPVAAAVTAVRAVRPTTETLVDRAIRSASQRHGVDEALIRAVIHVESRFDPNAVSHKGATGLMQLMPATARRFGVRDARDPVQNIHGGTHYLRVLLDLFDGDLKLALAGYNAGEGAVLKYKRRVPPYEETREYVQLVTQRYRVLLG